MALSRKRHFVALAIGSVIGLGAIIAVRIVYPELHTIFTPILFVLSVLLFSGIGRKRP